MVQRQESRWAGKKIGLNPTDCSKGGVKRSLLTEAHGIPLAIAIDGASRHDMKLVQSTLDDLKLDRPMPTAALPQGMCGVITWRATGLLE